MMRHTPISTQQAKDKPTLEGLTHRTGLTHRIEGLHSHHEEEIGRWSLPAPPLSCLCLVFSPNNIWRAAPYDRKGRAPNDSHVPLSRGGRDSALPDAQPPAFTSLRLQQRPGSASQSSLSAPPPWRRASSMHRVMDHPKASITAMAISASETSFNAPLVILILRNLPLPLRLCLFLPESLVILMLLLLPEMLHFILLL